MPTNNVFVLGGHQSDFARNWTREGLDFADLTTEVVAHTLAQAQVNADEIDVVHVGNAFGQLFTGQGQLGGMPATVDEALWGLPATRHEAACASGGVALLAAMADLESSRYDTALVLRPRTGETRPPTASARRRGPATKGRPPASCGRTCSAPSPTSTTAATAWTTPTCARSPS